MNRTACLLALLTALSFGCGGEKDVAESLDDKSFRDVLSEAEEDEYTGPEDGKLTRQQIEMYLEVREHEKAIAEAARKKLSETAENMKERKGSFGELMEGMKGFGAVADFVTADIRAAQDLGFNTAEYRWVKDAIHDSLSAEVANRARVQIKSQLATQRAEMEKRLAETDSEAEKKMYEGFLAQLDEAAVEDDEPESEATRYNRELLSEYEDTIETLRRELERWGGEGSAAELDESLASDN